MTSTAVSCEDVELFAASAAALGVEVRGRRQVADPDSARRGFTQLVRTNPHACDGWRGLAAAGQVTREVIEAAHTHADSFGALAAAAGVAADGMTFSFDTGLYVCLTAADPDSLILAAAAMRARDGELAQAGALLDDPLIARAPVWARWMRVVVFFHARRWHDVRATTATLGQGGGLDAFLGQAVAVADGIAAANLGLTQHGYEKLIHVESGPIPAATADALLTAGLCARALDKPGQANELLERAYTAADGDESARAAIASALADDTFGLCPTSAACIEARTDRWDPATEPTPAQLHREHGAPARAQLKAAAHHELAGFVGMDEVKAQIARLESSVRADGARAKAGLPTRARSLHMVLTGPPGTGKTSIARVIAKLLCAAEVLTGDLVVEATRTDLVGQVIGETGQKTGAVIDRIIEHGGGVLFIDEAYALTDSGAKNDFGPEVIKTLLKAMTDHPSELMVIAAGYQDKMSEFLAANDGLSSRFGRRIDLATYTPTQLLAITEAKAAGAASIIADPQVCAVLFTTLDDQCGVDADGNQRPALDVLGNGRFAENLITIAEENRDHRLDLSGALDADPGPDPAVLTTITAADITAAAAQLCEPKGFTTTTALEDR